VQQNDDGQQPPLANPTTRPSLRLPVTDRASVDSSSCRHTLRAEIGHLWRQVDCIRLAENHESGRRRLNASRFSDGT
jgi:hypothetical protein